MVYIVTIRPQFFVKKNIYVHVDKDKKKYPVRSSVVASKFVFFTGDTEK
jgi:hypothetical protein